MKIDYQNLEKKIKISFKNKSLLLKSLTHKSFDKKNNNEKIEFLGDRVLGLLMAKKILEISQSSIIKQLVSEQSSQPRNKVSDGQNKTCFCS